MDYIPLKTNSAIKKMPNKLGKKRKLKGNRIGNYPRDTQLLKRIQQVLGHVSNSVDIDALITELKRIYPEYRRKKVREFHNSVSSSIAVLKEADEQQSDQNSHESGDYFSENDDIVEYPDTNLVNNSISDMYKNSPKSSKKNKVTSLEAQNEKEIDVPPVKRARKDDIVEKKTKLKRKNELLLKNPQDTFKNVGGIDKILEELWELLVQFRHPEVYEHFGVRPPRGFLLHGPPGCGKTLLAHAIAGELQLPLLEVAATELVKGVSGESEEKIREIFDQAVANVPCILFIDEIDAITPKRDTAQREMERRIVTQLLACLDDISQKDASTQLVVIGATNRVDSLDPALRRAGRFDQEIGLGIPDEEARIKILKVLCENLNLRPDFDFQDLAHRSPGYVGADLMALTRKAVTCAIRRCFDNIEQAGLTDASDTEKNKNYSPWFANLTKPTFSINDCIKDAYIEQGDFLIALKSIQPSAKREGFGTVPDKTWDDVGALKTIREELQMAILAPVSHRNVFESLGLPTSSGILLCGPPGCGKTLLAKAIANESGLNFISVNGPELFNMYVGETERAVRQCFQRARNAAPCVIFFDELDALCPRRSKDSAVSSSSDRVVNQLLTEMDGMDSRKQVFILGATNRPDIIDPAIMRPGRLDKILYVGLPPPQDRIDILRTVTKNGTKPPLAEDVNLEVLGSDIRCDGFTGADLTHLVREASSLAIRYAMQNENKEELQSLKVKFCHFEEALRKVRPSVSVQDQKFYEKMKDKSAQLIS